MAKAKHQQSIAKQGNQHVIQTSYEEDDNLLPSPEELLKYKEMDPDFVNWIKNRCDIEQRARLKFNEDRIKLVRSTHMKIFTVDLASLFASVLVMLAGMYLSYVLIRRGQILTGSLFAGGIIVFYAIRVLNFRKAPADKNNKEPEEA